MLQIVTVPALKDNYDFLVHDPETGKTAVVDVADAAPVLAALEELGWSLDEIWLTHHHWDHVDGVADLVLATGASVTGAGVDAHRLPPLSRVVAAGDSFEFASHDVSVMAADGHTVGHIAYYVADAPALFSGDSLMVMGCGRLFEGTPAQMMETCQRFAALPDETQIYSGHEYTASNARFALTVEPENAALHFRLAGLNQVLADGGHTVPAPLGLEKATNPYLRAHLPEVKAALGMSDETDLDVFTTIRARKDAF